jgi:hypothetical protein
MATKKGRRQNSKRLTPRVKMCVKMKANDYPALSSGFSTELCRFKTKNALAAQNIITPCANVIVDAQFRNNAARYR